jgi:S-DNA-T family DNA segregation ATPase FtsK/SpoIIIE
MHSSARQLLGEWVVALVLGYFGEQRNAHSDKLFTRIAGMDDTAWGDILQAFQTAESKLAGYYRPILRTLTRVEGFDCYQCKEHETSTWLRNNNASGDALIIFMNEQSAEAQSLENIFTIDEARLLNADGLEVLYRLLSETYRYYGAELETLQTFMTIYSRISEPQLQNVLAFLAAVIEDEQLSMVDKVQRNLNQLLLFRDAKLIIRATDGFVRLKRNFQLSRLEKEGRASQKHEFIENLDEFIEKTTDGQGEHELWQKVSPELFRQQALAFIHHQSTELFQYEYDDVAAALNFKTGKKKLNERVNEFKELVEAKGAWTDERNGLLSETIEAMDDNPNPDKLQEFLDEFAGELQEHPKLRKDLERTIIRQRQLAEYTELSEALLRESILLLEKNSEELGHEVKFKLSVSDSSISEQHAQALRFHLHQLERLTGYISFNEASISASSEKAGGDIAFQLILNVDGREVDKSKFKLVQAFSGMLSGMIDRLRNEGYIPYIQKYYGDDVRSVNVLDLLHDRVSGNAALGQSEIGEAAAEFAEFVQFYTAELIKALDHGLCSLELGELEERLERLLGAANQSQLLSVQIYQYVGCLGVYDSYNCKVTDRVGFAEERIVTMLNPLRLIGYSKRISRIQSELTQWVAPEQASVNDVSDLDAYFQQLQERTARLSPHYFAVNGGPDQYLIERQERMGEGTFALNGQSSGEEQLVGTFADEFLSTVKTYLEVYPYARDGLDLVFLYCSHADYIKRAIDQIFKNTKVRKVKVAIHSEARGAAIYEDLNNWINQEEQYSERHNSFPKVEIQIIAEQSINAMMRVVSESMPDADIGVLVNYFGQSSSVQYRQEKVAVTPSDDWFDTIYREPLKKEDALKRVSLVSEKLPTLMQYFYKMQYMLHNGETLAPEEHYLLRNVISLTKQSDAELINFMHERFNWSLIIDRHLDKMLLRQVSSKAQIIKYKSNAGKDKGFRTLVSSSKYIRKLINEQSDHEYYDRLYHKFALLLKNEQINRQTIVSAIERVKEISGGVVLRAIGPGQFAHELMAIYLSTETRPAAAGELVIYSLCDELPWFQDRSGRRPDLVRTSIRRSGENIGLHFELVELKFIKHTIFEQERYDAIKQVKAGMELYQSRFQFSEHPASAELWRKELIYYLLEHNTYDVHDAKLLKELQDIPIANIHVSLTGSIDTFVYTSNLLELSIMEGHVNGYQTETLQNGFVNHIYNRTYILKALGAMQEADIPAFEMLPEATDFVTDKLGLEQEAAPQDDSNKVESAAAVAVPTEVTTAKEVELSEPVWFAIGPEVETSAPVEPVWEKPERDEPPLEGQQLEIARQEAFSVPLVAAAAQETLAIPSFPEQEALLDVAPPQVEPEDDIAALVEGYQKKLRYSFNQNGIQVKIVDSFVGVSVIRIVVEIPGDRSYSSIESRAKDIYLWLHLSSIPLIQLRNGRINIDINRDTPEIVYFERFMAQAREQFPPDKLRGKLVAPVGIGQLRELIAIDFSNSNTPHLLIGGTTGSGKSVTMNAIILALMCMYTPEEVQFIFVDPKKVEFMSYEKRRHTRLVITEIEEAIVALEQLVEEMDERYRLFVSEDVQSIDQYVEFTGNAMPRLVVVFDEFADFMEQEKSLSGRVESAILRLGAKARAAGIHLMICTQNPKADIVPTNIRNNLPARLALKTADHHASKIIINEEGAETLGGKGDFMMKVDLPEVVRGKSPFLTPRVKRALLRYFGGSSQQ